MKYTILKNVYIDKDEITEIKAIEHDTKTRFINFKFIGSNTVVDLRDCQVRVYAKNSRYIEIFNDLTVIDAKGGIAQLELTDKFLRPGITEYQLKIMPINGGQLSSNTMRIIVSEDLMQGNSIESSNEYKAFEKALKTLDQYDLRWQSGNIKTKDSVLFENVVLKAMEQLIYNGNKVYDSAHKPTPSDIGALPLTGGTIQGRVDVGLKDKYLTIGVGDYDAAIGNTKSGKWLQLKDDGRLCYSDKEIFTQDNFKNKLALPGYQMLPSGLVFQWGYVTNLSSKNLNTINLPIALQDNNYIAVATMANGDNTDPRIKTVYLRKDSFKIQAYADGLEASWLVVGHV